MKAIADEDAGEVAEQAEQFKDQEIDNEEVDEGNPVTRVSE